MVSYVAKTWSSKNLLAAAEGWNFSFSAILMLALALLLLVDKQIQLPAWQKSNVDEKVRTL